ncbi:hypothetical protein CBW65_22600 [Tumebacillus avium]|uniref:Endonuclease n=1 Tax=Tumebacillus avium TaxID=1903704 RepID=A0A1Y0IS81_9BACL|nr:hypothetical protein [Tumebacillus avium]ARU63478.1 hypothetical protein CBW65_22600 [Tumebacillus avium]
MNNYDGARNIALTLFQTYSAQGNDIVEAIRLAVEQATGFFMDVSKEELFNDIQAAINISVGSSSILTDEDEKHIPWLLENKADIKWELWNRYRNYLLQRKKWPLKIVDTIDKTSDEILGLLENPKDHNRSYDRRGLVVGYVQSGKTANFTGLINKAIDAGYQLVIVLAGMHNNLRSQTQMRLDEEVLGCETSRKHFKDQKGAKIGVSTLTGERFVNIGFLTSRDENGDFSRSIASTVSVHPGAQPFLLVVKKNASVLRNLVKYFRDESPLAEQDPISGRKTVKRVPLLLIDDEADQASINTGDVLDEDGKVLEEYDPTTINKLIRQLYVTFDQRAYVGYTATPFANIYVHNAATHDEFGDELFPNSFIISLPKPSNYVGPAEFFGLNNEKDRQQPLIRIVKDADALIPKKQSKEFVPSGVPDSLKEAIHSFILSTAIRRVRGQLKAHNVTANAN